MSSSRLTVEGRSIRLEQRVQIASLLEVFPELDADGDRFVAHSELDRASERLLAYLGSHYSLRTESDRAPLVGRPISLQLGAPDRSGALEPEHVDAVVLYECDAEPVALIVESSLFVEAGAAHRD